VIADGAPTSYVLIGFEQILNFINQLKTQFETVDTGDLKYRGQSYPKQLTTQVWKHG
jgi:hypothetical protein